MFIRRALALVLVVLWLWPAGLYAQSVALMEAYQQGETVYEAGQYERAIPFWRRALELGEREFGPEHPDVATSLNNLALLYEDRGRYEARWSRSTSGRWPSSRRRSGHTIVMSRPRSTSSLSFTTPKRAAA